MMIEKLVEDNLGLVHHFIKKYVRLSGDMGAYSYEDLYQVGCIGLWKAAQSYAPGRAKFSTYAYLLIRNEIYNELLRQNKFSREISLPDVYDSGELLHIAEKELDPADNLTVINLPEILQKAKEATSDTTRKGIIALEMMLKGMKCREIAAQMQVPVNHVTAWIAKARKYLRKDKKIMELMEEYFEERCA